MKKANEYEVGDKVKKTPKNIPPKSLKSSFCIIFLLHLLVHLLRKNISFSFL